MTAPTADGIVKRYLSRLDKELAGFPSTYRSEVMEEIREHVTEARGKCTTDAEVERMLERIGDPRAIVAEARERFDLPPVRANLTDVAALVLLGVSLSIVGYVIGLVLLWRSPAWTLRDKVAGTLAPAVALGLAAIANDNKGSGAFALAGLAIVIFACTPLYLAIRLRHKSRYLTVIVVAVATVAAVPLVIFAAIVTLLGSGASHSIGYTYGIVDGQHVCQAGINNAPLKTVNCDTVPTPSGGWNNLFPRSGYQYAVKNGERVCATVNEGSVSNVACNTIPAPAGGWAAVQSATGGQCGPSACTFVSATPGSTFSCSPVPNGQNCIATVPTFAPAPEPSNGR